MAFQYLSSLSITSAAIGPRKAELLGGGRRQEDPNPNWIGFDFTQFEQNKQNANYDTGFLF